MSKCLELKFIKEVLLLLLIFSVSCSFEAGKEDTSFKHKKVDEISIVIQADSSDLIAAPSWIKLTSGGFILHDAILEKISRFDMKGHHLLSFGGQGKGPGEFQDVGDFWEFNDVFLVYDITGQKLIIYDHSGNPIKDIPLDFVEFYGRPTGLEAISPHRFVMPSSGKNGSLLTLVDITSESTQFIGEAVAKDSGSQRFQSPDEIRKAIISGNIPAMYKNDVLLSSNDTGFFSFQQTTAMLEKYDNSGKLIWQKNIKVPAIDGLFEKLFEENRARIKREEMFLSFSYADGISANEKGVAIKLNLFEDQPVTVVWVPNNGEKVTVVTFPELQNLSPVPLRFAISSDTDILFSNILEGVIYRAKWPL